MKRLAANAHLLAGLHLIPHVDLRGGVFSHQHGGQPGPGVSRRQLVHLQADFFKDFVADLVAVEDAARHSGRVSEGPMIACGPPENRLGIRRSPGRAAWRPNDVPPSRGTRSRPLPESRPWLAPPERRARRCRSCRSSPRPACSSPSGRASRPAQSLLRGNSPGVMLKLPAPLAHLPSCPTRSRSRRSLSRPSGPSSNAARTRSGSSARRCGSRRPLASCP